MVVEKTIEAFVGATPPGVFDALRGHNLVDGFVHTNLQADMCACKGTGSAGTVVHSAPKPQVSTPDGGICFNCGGMTVRTGSCTTCTSCGTSGGCG